MNTFRPPVIQLPVLQTVGPVIGAYPGSLDVVWEMVLKSWIRSILLVEDSPVYYSRYLSFLYRVVLEQTRRIIDDVASDELFKILRLRARPKLLHAMNYEEAMKVIDPPDCSRIL